MVASKYTEKVAGQTPNPNLDSCVNACFGASKMGYSPLQTSAMLEKMPESGLMASQQRRPDIG